MRKFVWMLMLALALVGCDNKSQPEQQATDNPVSPPHVFQPNACFAATDGSWSIGSNSTFTFRYTYTTSVPCWNTLDGFWVYIFPVGGGSGGSSEFILLTDVNYNVTESVGYADISIELQGSEYTVWFGGGFATGTRIEVYAVGLMGGANCACGPNDLAADYTF